MKHKIIYSGMLFCAALSVACAGQQPSQTRLDAIWAVANNRVTDQVNAWFEDGDYPKVIHMLRMQAVDQPHNYDVVTNLGWMQENIEDWDGALATYKWYKVQNPQDRDAALPEATYYMMRHQYKDLPALLEPTLKRKPHPNIWRILAHSYERLNRYQDAERVWKAYIAWQPSDLQAKKNLASVERKLSAAKSR